MKLICYGVIKVGLGNTDAHVDPWAHDSDSDSRAWGLGPGDERQIPPCRMRCRGRPALVFFLLFRNSWRGGSIPLVPGIQA